MKFLRLFLFVLSSSFFPVMADERPNVLLILADDMGCGDVQALNPASKIPTPHLNELARGGAIFTDAHSGSAVCTPTRYGLLTGRYCWRTTLKKGVLVPPRDRPLIEDERVTIANFLKGEGYRTGMVGKWHLGIEWARDGKKAIFDAPFTNGPIEKGFEEWYGVAASLDMVPYVMLRNHEAVAKTTAVQEKMGFPKFIRKGPKDPGFDPGDALDLFAKEAGEFMKRGDEKPFFLYLPLTGPHKPVWPHERFVGKTELGPYGDFVHQVDHTVGLVLKALEESGKAKNTIVIYTSDNGSFMYRRGEGEGHHLAEAKDQGYLPKDHTANSHWRGTKADIWEGGHRVPFFVRWPEKIKAESKVDGAICLTDVLATVSEVLGKALPEGAGEDSFSFLPQALGKEAGKRPGVIHHSVAGMFAIRRGPWKLVLGAGSGGREKPRGKNFTKPYQLYKLDDDPSETSNVIEKNAEIAKEMEAELMKIVGEDL